MKALWTTLAVAIVVGLFTFCKRAEERPSYEGKWVSVAMLDKSGFWKPLSEENRYFTTIHFNGNEVFLSQNGFCERCEYSVDCNCIYLENDHFVTRIIVADDKWQIGNIIYKMLRVE